MTFIGKTIRLTGLLLFIGSVNWQIAYAEGNYTLSYQQIKQAADSGDPDAEYALGYMLYYGKSGVNKDPIEAKKWIAKAAAHQQPQAIRALQLMGDKASTPHTKVADKTPPTKNSVTSGETFVDMSKRETESGGKQASVNIPTNSYTLQLLAAADQNKAEHVLQEYHLEDQGKIFHTSHDSKEWYILVYGTYPTKAEAKIAANQLKKKTHLEPWIKPYAQVKKELKK